jgi:S-adenosylmethionine hydrolase
LGYEWGIDRILRNLTLVARIEFCRRGGWWGRLTSDMAVVTFTTDFGLADGYAAAMKGVVLSFAPDAVLVDISHAIPRHDIAAGAVALAQAAPFFPRGSVHVAVVDPGVGGERAELVVESDMGVFVGPDNGVLSVAARTPRAAFRIDNPAFRREPASPTFHGRDIFAVAAGRIAGGAPARQAGARLPAMVELDAMAEAPLTSDCRARVLHVDGFGNIVTSLVGDVSGTWQLDSEGRRFSIVGGHSYTDVAIGTLVLYTGSSGRIEIAVREGSAAALLGAMAGSTLELRKHS